MQKNQFGNQFCPKKNILNIFLVSVPLLSVSKLLQANYICKTLKYQLNMDQ